MNAKEFFEKKPCLDFEPLTAADLIKDSNIIIYSSAPHDSSATVHTVDRDDKLIIQDLIPFSPNVSRSLKKFEDEFLPHDKHDLSEKQDFPTITEILKKIDLLIGNYDQIKRSNTRNRLIILANLMSYCYLLTKLPSINFKKYNPMIKKDWQLLTHFAYLIDYNYVRDKEWSITYPVHHKLIVSQLENYFLVDVPLIYDIIQQINDIETFQHDPSHSPNSIYFKKNTEQFIKLINCYDKEEEFNKEINQLKSNNDLKNISITCEIVGNYDALKTILELINRAQSYDLTKSITAKYAFINCITSIGEQIKHLSDSLRGQFKHIEWKAFKEIRDFLDHPDEAGREEVLVNLLNNSYSHEGITLEKLQQELDLLASQIIMLEKQIYPIPSIAFLKQKKHPLKKSPIKSFTITPHLKANSKEKNKFYNLRLGKESADYWNQRFNGKQLLNSNDFKLLEEARQDPSLIQVIDKLIGIHEAVEEERKMTKWCACYQLPSKELKEFLALTRAVGKQDFWISVLDKKSVLITDSQINDLLAAIKISNLDKYDFVKTILEKINPSAIQKLVTLFKLNTKPNCNSLEIIDLLLSYLNLAAELLHDKLHNQSFIDAAAEKLDSFMFRNHMDGVKSLSPEQLKILSEIRMLYPDPSKFSKKECEEASKLYIEAGLYDYFEASRALSETQKQQIFNEYINQFDQEISNQLLADASFCDALAFFCIVSIGLVKKLLDKNVIKDQEVIPHLTYLKKCRNFLAHEDDYVSKIVQAPLYQHVKDISKSIDMLSAYFNILKNSKILQELKRITQTDKWSYNEKGQCYQYYDSKRKLTETAKILKMHQIIYKKNNSPAYLRIQATDISVQKLDLAVTEESALSPNSMAKALVC